jgi:hypothetical protein
LTPGRATGDVGVDRAPLLVDPTSITGNVVPVHGKGGPTTLDAWVDYVTTVPQRPAMTTRPRYEKAPQQVRNQFNLARAAYHRSLADIQTPQMYLAHDEISSRVQGNQGCPPTARTGLVISGQPNLGKSTLILRWGKVFELALREEYGVDWDARTTEGGLFVPVVYVILGDDDGPKGLCQKMMRFYGQPFRESWDAAVLTDDLKTLAVRCGTRVLLIDQMHNLQMSNRSGKHTANHLKELMDVLPVTVVGAAVDIDGTRFFSDGQIAGRFGVHYIEPFGRQSDADKTTLLSLLETVYDRFVLLDKRPGDMAAVAGYIYSRTNGVTGDLMDLLRRGANAAVGDAERLNHAILDKISLSASAQRKTSDPVLDALQDVAAAAASTAVRKATSTVRRPA